MRLPVMRFDLPPAGHVGLTRQQEQMQIARFIGNAGRGLSMLARLTTHDGNQPCQCSGSRRLLVGFFFRYRFFFGDGVFFGDGFLW